MQFVWSIGGGSRCRVIRACVCYLVQTFCTEQRFQTFRAQLGGECRELTTDMKSSFLPLLVFSLSHSVMSNSLQPHGLYSPWNYLGQNTGVGSLSLLQGSFQPRDRTQVSLIVSGLFTSRATREAQEYWSEYSIPTPADLPDLGIEPGSPALQAYSLSAELSGKPSKRKKLSLFQIPVPGL